MENCFLCSKKIGLFREKYSIIDFQNEKVSIPPNFPEDRRICGSCFNQQKGEKKAKKVSTGWQCAMVLFVPLGLWAFYRIKKLRYGVLIYLITGFGISFGVPFLVLYIVSSSTDDEALSNIVYSLSAVFAWIFGIAIAMWYMQKWSDKWNENLPKEPF